VPLDQQPEMSGRNANVENLQVKALRFYLIAGAILLAQSIDLFKFYADNDPAIYLFNTFVDTLLFFSIYLVHYFITPLKFNIPLYIWLLFGIQSLSIFTHLTVAYSEFQYMETGVEVWAVINDKYETVLSAIFVLKMVVLGQEGYDLLRRKRTTHTHYTDNPGLVVVGDNGDNQGILREKIKR